MRKYIVMYDRIFLTIQCLAYAIETRSKWDHKDIRES